MYIYKRIYSARNIQEFLSSVSNTDWSSVLESQSAQDSFSIFHSKLITLHEKHFPKKKLKRKYNNKKPWLSQALRECIEKKNKLYAIYKKIDCCLNEMKYKKYKNKLQNILLAAEKKHYSDLFIKYKSNMQKSWSVIKCMINRNRSCKIQKKFMLNSGLVVTDGNVISENFNNFFY